jgi:hypothetical protein
MIVACTVAAKNPVGREHDLGYIRELLTYFREKRSRDIQDACSRPHEGLEPLCGFLSYVTGNRRDPRAFLSTTPRTENEATRIWDLDALMAKTRDRTIDEVFPSGFAARYIDELAHAAKSLPEVGLPRLLALYGYADGSYRETVYDELLHLVIERPDLFYGAWDAIRPYKAVLRNLIYDDEEPSQLQADFRRLCEGSRTTRRCKEILGLWEDRREPE